MAINTYIFNGHLGGDAEVKTLDSGSIVISFSVAVSETWKDKSGEKKEKTNWVKCSKWVSSGGSSKIADFLKKGQKVVVQGKPEARAFLDKNGEAKSILEVNVSELSLVGGKSDTTNSEQSNSSNGGYSNPNPTYGQQPIDDLPF